MPGCICRGLPPGNGKSRSPAPPARGPKVPRREHRPNRADEPRGIGKRKAERTSCDTDATVPFASVRRARGLDDGRLPRWGRAGSAPPSRHGVIGASGAGMHPTLADIIYRLVEGKYVPQG
jgi:hypothetical protein